MSVLTQQVTLDAVLAKRVAGMASIKGESFEAMVNKLVEKAVKDVAYRTKRNQRQWAMTKALNAAVKAGTITLPTDEELDSLVEAELGE